MSSGLTSSQHSVHTYTNALVARPAFPRLLGTPRWTHVDTNSRDGREAGAGPHDPQNPFYEQVEGRRKVRAAGTDSVIRMLNTGISFQRFYSRLVYDHNW